MKRLKPVSGSQVSKCKEDVCHKQGRGFQGRKYDSREERCRPLEYEINSYHLMSVNQKTAGR